MSYFIIALIGKSGSGKDTLMNQWLRQAPSFNKIINYTTRPPREGEIDGVDYYFITDKEFKEKIDNHEMLEHTTFKGWQYGTAVDSLKKYDVNIGVFNPYGLAQLEEEAERRAKSSDIDTFLDIHTFYIQASDKTRLLRQLYREENPDVEEIIRRWQTDNEDFAALPFDYKEISNDATIEEALAQIQGKTL